MLVQITSFKLRTCDGHTNTAALVAVAERTRLYVKIPAVGRTAVLSGFSCGSSLKFTRINLPGRVYLPRVCPKIRSRRFHTAAIRFEFGLFSRSARKHVFKVVSRRRILLYLESDVFFSKPILSTGKFKPFSVTRVEIILCKTVIRIYNVPPSG